MCATESAYPGVPRSTEISQTRYFIRSLWQVYGLRDAALECKMGHSTVLFSAMTRKHRWKHMGPWRGIASPHLVITNSVTVPNTSAARPVAPWGWLQFYRGLEIPVISGPVRRFVRPLHQGGGTGLGSGIVTHEPLCRDIRTVANLSAVCPRPGLLHLAFQTSRSCESGFITKALLTLSEMYQGQHNHDVLATQVFRATCTQITFLITRITGPRSLLPVGTGLSPHNSKFRFVEIPRLISFGYSPPILLGPSMCERCAIGRPTRNHRFRPAQPS
jgi:hypothetical protein